MYLTCLTLPKTSTISEVGEVVLNYIPQVDSSLIIQVVVYTGLFSAHYYAEGADGHRNSFTQNW